MVLRIISYFEFHFLFEFQIHILILNSLSISMCSENVSIKISFSFGNFDFPIVFDVFSYRHQYSNIRHWVAPDELCDCQFSICVFQLIQQIKKNQTLIHRSNGLNYNSSAWNVFHWLINKCTWCHICQIRCDFHQIGYNFLNTTTDFLQSYFILGHKKLQK